MLAFAGLALTVLLAEDIFGKYWKKVLVGFIFVLTACLFISNYLN